MSLSETMTELRDDGHSNIHHVEPLWEGCSGPQLSNGGIPEDGQLCQTGTAAYPNFESVRVLPDGSRNVRTRAGGRAWHNHCALFRGGTEMICHGEHMAADAAKQSLYQPPLWLTQIRGSPGGRSKQFFFEKKNQKTFVLIALRLPHRAHQ